MARWITNWPGGEGRGGSKWASCTAALAAQIVAEGRQGGCQVKLVKNTIRLSRHVLLTPEWARPRVLGAPMSRAVTMALRLSPMDRRRAA